MVKKFYAVRQGKVPGIYLTWGECQKQTSGYKGAEFKSFSTQEEAELYIQFIDASTPTTKNNSTNEIESYLKQLSDDTIVAFVDGSFDSTSQKYGYGVILIDSKGNEEELLGNEDNKDYTDSRNVAGEIAGVQSAINYAIVNSYKKVVIFYDYEGIEKWAQGEWKANKKISKDYVSFIKGIEHSVQLEFRKVKAHSGIEYNERADALARKSLLNKGIKGNSNGSISLSGIDMDDFNIIIDLLQQENQDIKPLINTSFKNRKVVNLKLNKEQVTITIFNNGTTTIQGKQSKLLEALMVLVIQLIPNENEVVEILNDYHDVSIPKDELELTFDSLVPNFSSTKTGNPKLLNVLKQAAYNTMLKGQRPDYTDLATPGLRVLEFYLKEILINIKGIIPYKDAKNSINCFDKDANNIYYIQPIHQPNFTPEELNYVNELYNFYYNHRHTLNHWNIDGTTRTLKTMQEARDLIKNNLELINRFYLTF